MTLQMLYGLLVPQTRLACGRTIRQSVIYMVGHLICGQLGLGLLTGWLCCAEHSRHLGDCMRQVRRHAALRSTSVMHKQYFEVAI